MDIKTLNGNPIADTAARQTLTQKQDKISDIDDIRREASEGKQARITNEVNENRRKIVIPIKRNPIYPEVPSLYAFLYSSRLLDFPTYYNFQNFIIRSQSEYSAVSVSEKYYSSIVDAVNDSNGSTSSDGNTVKRIFCTNSNDSNISYFCHLKLVGDVQLTEEVRVYDSLFIDLNGHTISITNDGSIKFDNYENRMFVLYGKKNNSSVNCILTGTSKCAFACPRFTYVIGGNYTFSAAPDDYRRHSLFEIYDGGSRTDYKKSDFNVLSYFKDINVVARNSKTDSMRIIHDSRFELSSTLYIKGCVFDWLTKNAKYNSGHVVYSQAMNTIIEQTKIKHLFTVDYGDETLYSIWRFGNSNSYLYIKNSEIISTNATIGASTNGSETVIVENSHLIGGIHGGIYAADHSCPVLVSDELTKRAKHQTFNIKNSVLQLGDTSLFPSLTGRNNYASYFGYGCDVNCHNVVFNAPTDSGKAPAIKQGESKYGDTSTVRFSKCDMKSIRCDANCNAYIGAEMPESIKNSTVSGNKVLTDDYYTFDTILDLGF